MEKFNIYVGIPLCSNYGNLKASHMPTSQVISIFDVTGWTHNFLPKSEPPGLLSRSSRHWSFHLHVEGQCNNKSDCGICDTGLELVGCLSFHEFSCKPKKKGTCTLPCISHVCISWFSHHRH